MALITTDAIVLRTYNLAEADRIVLCLTRTAGLVRAVAKGARRMKSRFGAALEPFTLIKLAFYEKENRELVTMSQAEIIKSRFDLASQAEASEVLAYMGELVSEFAPPHESNEKMFRMVSACVDALAEKPNAARIVTRYFEVWLLRLAGLFPDVRACGECGVRIAEGDAVYLDVEVKPHCRNCAGVGNQRLLADTQRSLIGTQQLAPIDFANVFQQLPTACQAQLADLTHRLIVRALERRPRTLVAAPR
ncbi:MAG: DNA repair protein RecO [Acidobacteriota bacterium]